MRSKIYKGYNAILGVRLNLALLVIVVLSLLGYGEFEVVLHCSADNGIGVVLLLCNRLLLTDEFVILSCLVGKARLRLCFEVLISDTLLPVLQVTRI